MDKDESFDRLAKRLLRARTPAAGTCLDAETLAAWSSGTLSSEQRAAAEAHLADCDRCLAILSTLESVPAQTAARPAWASWRWLVPLTTAAAALTVVVLMHESTPQPQSPKVVATAPVGEIPDAAPESKTLADAAQPAAVPRPAPPTAADEWRRSARAGERAAAPAPGRAAAPTSKERVQQSAKLPHVAEQQRATRADAPGSGGAQSTGRGREDVAPRAAAAPAPPPPPASPPLPSANPEARDQLRRAEVAAPFRAPVEIASPDPAVRWRFFGQVVERSADGGRTWQRQDTGADGILVGGSAPSAAVFWIVGADGLVLLTADGRTWRAATRPAAVNLVSVAAADATTAVVTTADGRAFRTTDGGRTWVAQEKPPAPF